jgi:hypothetical protein
LPKNEQQNEQDAGAVGKEGVECVNWEKGTHVVMIRVLSYFAQV